MNFNVSKKTELFIKRLVMLGIMLSIFALVLIANTTQNTPTQQNTPAHTTSNISFPTIPEAPKPPIKVDVLIQEAEKQRSNIECEYDYELKALRASNDNAVALREQLVTYINEKDFEKRNDTVPLHRYIQGMKSYKKDLTKTCKRLCKKRNGNAAANDVVTKINDLSNNLTELETCLKKHKDFIKEARFLKTQKSPFEKIFGPLSSASSFL